MGIKRGLLAALAALSINYAASQELPQVPTFKREYEKVGNIWTYLFPSYENVTWQSSAYQIHNSPAVDVNEMHGYAGVTFENPKLQDFEISLGFLTKVYSRNGRVEKIENIVYEYDQKKRKASQFDLELARKNNIPTEKLMDVNYDVLDMASGTAHNPEKDTSFNVPQGVADFQYGFFKLREHVMRNKVEKLDTTMTFLYKHAAHNLGVSVFREDEDLKVSLDLTVPSSVQGKRRSLVPGLEKLIFTLDENYLPRVARGEGTLLFVPVGVEVEVKE